MPANCVGYLKHFGPCAKLHTFFQDESMQEQTQPIALHNENWWQRWAYGFIFLHVLLWTLVPALVRLNLPLDAMEGTTWGRQLEWGYDKNPFLNAWLTELAVMVGGKSGWMVYLFGQLSIALCFWAVWKLGKKILTPAYAFLAVLLLETNPGFNISAINLNDNTLEVGLWAAAAWFFYQAIKTEKLRNWCWLGLLAGLGMMAKYYTLFLLVAMLIFLLQDKNNWQYFRKTGFYLALIIFLIVIAPHVVWLFSHQFITVEYAFKRGHAPHAWLNHIAYAFDFTQQQVMTFLAAVMLSGILFIGYKPLLANPRLRVNSFDKRFLFYVGLGPLILTLLLSIVGGIRLYAGWGQPLLWASTLILLAILQPRITRGRFYFFISIFFILLVTAITLFARSHLRADSPASSIFPGKIIATTLTKEWHDRYHTPLRYVTGSRWLAGNVSFYSEDRPAVYIDWDPQVSFWIDLKKLQRDGAIFLWDITEEDGVLPPEVAAEFPRLEKSQIRYFLWQRNPKLSPLKIGVAFLPPEK
jgi:4-amino-4-deoxy-L-arabinose transferase-like glycosyltransferase